MTNLNCVNQVCRPALTVGSNCNPSSSIGCGTGLFCNGDTCVIPNQKGAGLPCTVGQECLSSTCASGRCQERSRETCYSNTDCASLSFASVCGGSNGTCTIGNQFAVSAYYACQVATCTTSVSPTAFCGCEQQYVIGICQNFCLQRPDLRNPLDGYIYDCTALKRTIPGANTCEILSVVTNCPANTGAIQKLSLFMIMIILFFL